MAAKKGSNHWRADKNGRSEHTTGKAGYYITQEVLSQAFKLEWAATRSEGLSVGLPGSQPQGLQRGLQWRQPQGWEVCLRKMLAKLEVLQEPAWPPRLLRDVWSCTVTRNAKLQTSAFLKDATLEWQSEIGLIWKRKSGLFVGVFKGSRDIMAEICYYPKSV